MIKTKKRPKTILQEQIDYEIKINLSSLLFFTLISTLMMSLFNNVLMALSYTCIAVSAAFLPKLHENIKNYEKLNYLIRILTPLILSLFLFFSAGVNIKSFIFSIVFEAFLVVIFKGSDSIVDIIATFFIAIYLFFTPQILENAFLGTELPFKLDFNQANAESLLFTFLLIYGISLFATSFSTNTVGVCNGLGFVCLLFTIINFSYLFYFNCRFDIFNIKQILVLGKNFDFILMFKTFTKPILRLGLFSIFYFVFVNRAIEKYDKYDVFEEVRDVKGCIIRAVMGIVIAVASFIILNKVISEDITSIENYASFIFHKIIFLKN